MLVKHSHDVCDLGNISVGVVEDDHRLAVAWDFNRLRGAVRNQSKGRRSVSRRRLPEEDGGLSRWLLGFADGRVHRGRFSHALSVQ